MRSEINKAEEQGQGFDLAKAIVGNQTGKRARKKQKTDSSSLREE
jgi:hypothetical protein